MCKDQLSEAELNLATKILDKKFGAAEEAVETEVATKELLEDTIEIELEKRGVKVEYTNKNKAIKCKKAVCIFKKECFCKTKHDKLVNNKK